MLTQVFLYFVFVILLDFYCFSAFRWLTRNQTLLRRIYIGVHIIIYLITWWIFFYRYQVAMHWGFLIISTIFTLYVPKAVIAAFLLLEDIKRMIRFVKIRLQTPKPTDKFPSQHTIPRSTFISQLAIITSTIPFGGFLYGITKGKYQYQINRINLPIKNLPLPFHGLTITQISDIHTGSFDDREAVARGIELIDKQQSDLIFFTGDIINEHIKELYPFEDMWKTLKAKEGVFSVLGNHDYGDYTGWPNRKAKEKHFKEVLASHKRMGWSLLMNEHYRIQRGEDSLAIIGVENWSSIERFPRYGKIDRAVKGTEDAAVKLLLSHDPTHWDAQIRPQHVDIDVTFSGHTHGFQMGVEIPGFRWSPAQYLYKQWAGLYQEGDQYLYVNRGFGFIGFSGRVGIWPEITVFTLVPQS